MAICQEKKNECRILSDRAGLGVSKQRQNMLTFCATSCPDVEEMLLLQHAQKKKEDRECLLKIMANLKFLATQGLPLQGDGDDSDSNFIPLRNSVQR